MLTLLVIVVAGCKNPSPQCAPRGEPYRVCSADQVWSCPEGDADTVAANQAIDEACQTADDPVQCVLDGDYEYIDMTLAEDCPGGGQVCTEDPFADPPVATCDDPA
jgi:hypothetical protein